MKLGYKLLRGSAQSWMNRVEREPALNVGYNSEPRDWLQRAISEAEKNKDVKKAISTCRGDL